MCRLVAYLGHPTLLKNVLVTPKNSLIMQSLHARETELRTNGDGFGLGWYAHDISTEPALFTSIAPAWNDRNLLNLTSIIQSPCFFAHVRSASNGGVTTYNCHPFIFGDWMLMHNGEIFDFVHVKRHIRHLLDDDVYHWLKGDTDSEHIFALFMQKAKGRDLNHLAEVADVMQETLQVLDYILLQYGKKGVSYYNICLTDGHRMVATRYCSSKRHKPYSLHYLIGRGLVNPDFWGVGEGEPSYVVVSSEKLNGLSQEWTDVPANNMILIDKNKSIQCRALL
jgi:glutamine amidotransferase